MSRLLLVVVREEPGRYAYFKHTYSSDTVEVIIDRRPRGVSADISRSVPPQGKPSIRYLPAHARGNPLEFPMGGGQGDWRASIGWNELLA